MLRFHDADTSYRRHGEGETGVGLLTKPPYMIPHHDAWPLRPQPATSLILNNKLLHDYDLKDSVHDHSRLSFPTVIDLGLLAQHSVGEGIHLVFIFLLQYLVIKGTDKRIGVHCFEFPRLRYDSAGFIPLDCCVCSFFFPCLSFLYGI